MARRDLASAFYPNSIKADIARLADEIVGELVTRIEREEASREDRRYRLAFRIDAGRIGPLPKTTGGPEMTRRTGAATASVAHPIL